MKPETHGLARSVHTRLVRHAKSLGVDAGLILTRFATERFLYRLSRSPHAERFVLKGALLMLVWLGETVRPTRDADLLGFGELSDETLATSSVTCARWRWNRMPWRTSGTLSGLQPFETRMPTAGGA